MPVRPNAFAIPEAKNPSGKCSIIDDGIEAPRFPIGRISVARRKKRRYLVPRPIFVDRYFRRRHLRIDRHAASRDGIQAIRAERLIERVIYVDAPEMPVAGPTKIRRADFVRLKNADRRGPREKTVVVVVNAGIVPCCEQLILNCVV